MNGNNSVCNFWNFLFKKLFKKQFRSSAHDDLRFVSFQFYTFNNSFYCFALFEIIRRDLLFFRQNNLFVVFIDQNYSFWANMAYFCRINFVYHIFKLFVKIGTVVFRSEEHTSELQSRPHLVCRLLLEKKKKKII